MGRTVYSSVSFSTLKGHVWLIMSFFLSCQSKCRLEMTSSCLRELYNTSLVLWHSAVHIVETESDEHLPIINKTADLPDPQGVTCVFHIFLALLPQQRPADTTGKEDKMPLRPRNAFLHSALVHHMQKHTGDWALLPGRFFACHHGATALLFPWLLGSADLQIVCFAGSCSNALQHSSSDSKWSQLAHLFELNWWKTG